MMYCKNLTSKELACHLLMISAKIGEFEDKFHDVFGGDFHLLEGKAFGRPIFPSSLALKVLGIPNSIDYDQDYIYDQWAKAEKTEKGINNFVDWVLNH